MLLELVQQAKGGNKDSAGGSNKNQKTHSKSSKSNVKKTTAKKKSSKESGKSGTSDELLNSDTKGFDAEQVNLSDSSENIQKVAIDDLSGAEELLDQAAGSGLESSVLDSSNFESNNSLSSTLCQRWDRFLLTVEKHNSTLAALLRSGKPQAGKNGEARVQVFYRFHQEQLEQPKFKTIIEECGKRVVGERVRFKFVLLDTPKEAEVLDVPNKTDSLEALVEETLA